MKKKQLCLNVSKRNEELLDLVEDYSIEFNLPKTQTVFKVFKKYDSYRCNGIIK